MYKLTLTLDGIKRTTMLAVESEKPYKPEISTMSTVFKADDISKEILRRFNRTRRRKKK